MHFKKKKNSNQEPILDIILMSHYILRWIHGNKDFIGELWSGVVEGSVKYGTVPKERVG